MRSSNGNLNRLAVVSEHQDQLDENGTAIHLCIREHLTDEVRLSIHDREAQARAILFPNHA